jgi:pyridoxine 5-phosphate synthase
MVEGAAKTGTDRIELYTEAFARQFAMALENKSEEQKLSSVYPYKLAAEKAHELGLGINAGHDLDQYNLGFFKKHVPQLDEVSIGHALICDALYLGLENTIQIYKRQLSI